MRRSFPGVPANILGMLVSGSESPAGTEICLLLKYPRSSLELNTTIPTLRCWGYPADEHFRCLVKLPWLQLWWNGDSRRQQDLNNSPAALVSPISPI